MIVTLYYMALLFAIYSILGWCTEVIYHAVNTGKYVNRGFLSGPVCPIYGVGIGFVLLVLSPVSHNVLLTFIGSVILTTIIEFITGYVLEKLFHQKWWDYSNDPFNIKGYICLKFSLIWGVACVIIVIIIQPIFYKLIHITPFVIGIAFIIFFYATFIVDLIITVMTMLNIRERIHIINRIYYLLQQESELIGENLSDGVMMLMKAKDEIKEKSSEELAELKEKYEKVVNLRTKEVERMMRAFPKLELIKNKEPIEKLKLKLKNK